MNDSSLDLQIEEIYEEEKPYKCVICDISFKRKIHLKGHMKSVHDENSLFVCDVCKSGYVQNCDLQNHLKLVHDGEKLETKEIKCPICKASFACKVK